FDIGGRQRATHQPVFLLRTPSGFLSTAVESSSVPCGGPPPRVDCTPPRLLSLSRRSCRAAPRLGPCASAPCRTARRSPFVLERTSHANPGRTHDCSRTGPQLRTLRRHVRSAAALRHSVALLRALPAARHPADAAHLDRPRRRPARDLPDRELRQA